MLLAALNHTFKRVEIVYSFYLNYTGLKKKTPLPAIVFAHS